MERTIEGETDAVSVAQDGGGEATGTNGETLPAIGACQIQQTL